MLRHHEPSGSQGFRAPMKWTIFAGSGIVYLDNDGSNRAITAAVNGRKEL